MKNYIFFLSIILFSFNACLKPPPPKEAEKPCPPTPSNYKKGIFIVNKGSEDRKGSISYLLPETGYKKNNLYLHQNINDTLGHLIISMATFEGKGYIVENSTNRIIIVDLNNFKKIGEITGFEQPRFILPLSNGKAYVSQWGNDGFTGSIKIIDLSSHSIVETIPTLSGPEKMIQVGIHVYVANSGGDIIENKISKISTLSNQVVKTIEIGDVPESIQIDKNNNIWVLARGLIDMEHPENNTMGTLAKLENDEVILSLELATGAEDLIINNNRDMLYFNMNAWVYEHGINEESISLIPFIDQYFVGLGIDPHTSVIYGANGANTFVAGTIVDFSAGGVERDSWRAAFAPSEFWFQ